MINRRSVSSARRVRTNRSAKQFVCGQRGGIRTHLNAHIGQDSINRRSELASSILDEEPELGGAVARKSTSVGVSSLATVPTSYSGRHLIRWAPS